MKTSSRAMLMAHHLYTSDRKIIAPITHIEVRSWSQCLRMAWYFIRLRKALSTGFATFSFFKKDGSIREAKGTLFMPLIPADKWPKTNSQEPIANSQQQISAIAFFDLDKQEWRSFSISNFIGFVTLYEVKESKEKEPKRK